MSKKNRNRASQAETQSAAPAVQPPQPADSAPAAAPQQALPPDAAQAAAPQAPDASFRYFIIFWAIIILAFAASWILAIVLPGVSESLIERWIMAGLAASLAVFLFFYR
jgi:hypothetical protein